MNSFQGTISSIEGSETLCLVKVKVKDKQVSALFINNPKDTPFELNENVRVIFKETEVIIATGDVSNISLQNKFLGIINEITHSKVLCKIKLDSEIGTIYSIITNNAVKQLGLTIGDQAYGMIKTNEILLAHD